MAKKKKTPPKMDEEDPNKSPALREAEKDIENDPDLAPDDSDSADLDEGELAQKDNSND